MTGDQVLEQQGWIRASNVARTREEMIAQAGLRGCIIFTFYQRISWTPDQLKKENDAGRFLWGVSNFWLIPKDKYEQMRAKEARGLRREADAIESSAAEARAS